MILRGILFFRPWKTRSFDSVSLAASICIFTTCEDFQIKENFRKAIFFYNRPDIFSSDWHLVFQYLTIFRFLIFQMNAKRLLFLRLPIVHLVLDAFMSRDLMMIDMKRNYEVHLLNFKAKRKCVPIWVLALFCSTRQNYSEKIWYWKWYLE